MNPKFVVPFVALLLAVLTVNRAAAQVIFYQNTPEIVYVPGNTVIVTSESGGVKYYEGGNVVIVEADTATPTTQPTETNTPIPTPQPTNTLTPSPTTTATRTPTPVPTGTPVPTATATITPTATATETATPSPEPTATATIIPLSCTLQKQGFSIDEEIVFSIVGEPSKVVEVIYQDTIIGNPTLNAEGVHIFSGTYSGPGGEATIVCRYQDMPEVTSSVTAFVTVPATATATFTPTATATLPTANELEYYHASPTTDKILLEWATEREININGFKILRKLVSEPDTAYQSIGSRIALGSSTSGATYKFEVTSDIVPGESYCFRLEEITTNGKPGEVFDLCGYELTQVAEIVPQQSWWRSIFNWENVSRYWWIFLITVIVVAAIVATFFVVERRKRRSPSP